MCVPTPLFPSPRLAPRSTSMSLAALPYSNLQRASCNVPRHLPNLPPKPIDSAQLHHVAIWHQSAKPSEFERHCAPDQGGDRCRSKRRRSKHRGARTTAPSSSFQVRVLLQTLPTKAKELPVRHYTKNKAKSKITPEQAQTVTTATGEILSLAGPPRRTASPSLQSRKASPAKWSTARRPPPAPTLSE